MDASIILSENQKSILEQIIQRIVKVIGVEAVFCFGMQCIARSNWSCFVAECNSEIIRFDLLILTNNLEKRNRNSLSVLARQQGRTNVSLNCVVHDWASVVRSQNNAGSFYTSIVQNGFSVYQADRGKNSIDSLYTPIDISEAVANWDQASALAHGFYASAQGAIKNNSTAIAVFLLHQATEHICRALIGGVTGYGYSTHNLEKLLCLVCSFFPPIETVFPRNTKEEIELFGILLTGYGDSRYKRGYSVPPEKVLILSDRVRVFQYMAEAFFKLKNCREMKIKKLPLLSKFRVKMA